MAESHAIVSDPFTVTFIRIKARQLCRRTDFSRSDYDDLRQAMRLYLLDKAHLFDPTKGTMEAFVTQCVKTWVAMHLRYRGRAKRCESYTTLSLERTLVESGDDTTALGNVLLEDDGRRRTQACPLSPTEQFELREAVDHAMAGLNPHDRAVLTHVAEHGVASAARAFEVSRRQIANTLDRTREHFERAGLGPNGSRSAIRRGIGNQRARGDTDG